MYVYPDIYTRALGASFRPDFPSESPRKGAEASVSRPSSVLLWFVLLQDALADSATGSRLLEVAVPLLAPSEFQIFFSSWIIKRIDHLAQGTRRLSLKILDTLSLSLLLLQRKLTPALALPSSLSSPALFVLLSLSVVLLGLLEELHYD